jgi:hypothetical protein
MNKKIISIIIILLLVIVIGIFFTLYKPQPDSLANVGNITQSGVLVKNDWSKSLGSYCSQSSDYFTLKTNDEELVLEFDPIYTDMQMSQFSGKNVSITGEKKEKKIECPEGSQCPKTPDSVFTCEVFKVNKISL